MSEINLSDVGKVTKALRDCPSTYECADCNSVDFCRTLHEPNRGLCDCLNENAADHLDALAAELERYRQWVNDLQSGMYINCVYCGHRYGPRENTPVSMADVLKEHIEHCPEHPMSKLKAKNAELEAKLRRLRRSRIGRLRTYLVIVRPVSTIFSFQAEALANLISSLIVIWAMLNVLK